MAAAAVTSPACPLRRSSRLTSRRAQSDPDDDDHDENELTPRALRALKRQRLALHIRPRPKRRRKENLPLPSSPLPTPPRNENRPQLSLNLSPDPPSPPPVRSPEPPTPLTPLTPLTPSPECSPSLPGHDRPSLPPSPPHDPNPQPADPLPSPPLPASLDAPLDTLIPLDALHPQFPPDVPIQIPPPCQPPQPPLQPLELQDQFHPFPQQPLYVPPPLFVRDREINIWKLACQERVDCLLRRYGVDYIKALVESEARSLPQDLSPSPTTSHTKFRLYTPASYTYSSSWGTPRPPKALPLDDEPEPGWPIDDPDWADADVDMEDDDDDDYEDDEDAEGEPAREGEVTLDTPGAPKTTSTPVDPPPAKRESVPETTATSGPPPPSPAPDLAPRPLPTPLYLPPPPLAPPLLPPLSSLHVPLLSEPPRAFMGRGTPPDRRRLIEWSDSGRFSPSDIGPPLYLVSTPQRLGAEVDMVPMSVDAPLPSPPSPPSHPHGEWTSFLFSVLEGDGVGVGTSMTNAPHPSEPTWYELGLGTVPNNGLELPLAPPTPTRAPGVEQPVEEGGNSSSTLRFALG